MRAERAERLQRAAGPSERAERAERAVGFRGQLRVFWWAADARGRRVRATHAPVEVAFLNAAGLRAALEGFARAAAWERVLARRADAGLAAVLFERGAARDFEAEAGRFLARLRERGRSRCELEVHECGAGGADGDPAGAPWGPAGDPAWEGMLERRFRGDDTYALIKGDSSLDDSSHK